jgi:hypothetical protein
MMGKVMRRLSRVIGLSGLGALLLASTAGVAWADSAPPARELSQFETHWGASLGRDCGFSRQLASGQSLWVFCDTAIYDWTGKLTGFIAGSSAAEGQFTPGQVPTTLTEVPTPPAALNPPGAYGPARFLPNPTGLTRQDGSACTASSSGYPAAWTSGVAREPNGSSRLVITYAEVCVDNGALLVEGMGILEYDSAANAIVSGPTEVFRAQGAGAQLPPQLQLGSPIFSNGFLYLFASVCDRMVFGTCTSGRIFVANVLGAPSYWQSGANYFWWFSTAYPGWSQSYQSAQSVISGATPAAITADSYPGKGLAIVEETSIGGSYRIWRSPSGTFAGGSWSQGPSASSLPGCDKASGLNLCRALTGHPEISTSNQLLLSYFDPDPAVNHVMVVSVGGW